MSQLCHDKTTERPAGAEINFQSYHKAGWYSKGGKGHHLIRLATKSHRAKLVPSWGLPGVHLLVLTRAASSPLFGVA